MPATPPEPTDAAPPMVRPSTSEPVVLVTAETTIYLYHPDQHEHATALYQALVGANLDAQARTISHQAWEQIRAQLATSRIRIDIVDMRPDAAWRHQQPSTVADPSPTR